MPAKAPLPFPGFSSRLSFVLAAVGAAVGLGNVWRFPYEAGENGGAAFVLVYLVGLVLVAAPIFMCEALIGRRGRGSPPTALERQAHYRALGARKAVDVRVQCRAQVVGTHHDRRTRIVLSSGHGYSSTRRAEPPGRLTPLHRPGGPNANRQRANHD